MIKPTLPPSSGKMIAWSHMVYDGLREHVFHIWRHMTSRTILPGRCRHCTMAAPVVQRRMYKYNIFRLCGQNKTDRICESQLCNISPTLHYNYIFGGCDIFSLRKVSVLPNWAADIKPHFVRTLYPAGHVAVVLPWTSGDLATVKPTSLLVHHETHLASDLSRHLHDALFAGIAYRCPSWSPAARTFSMPHDSRLYVGGQDTLAEPRNVETAFFMRNGTRSAGGTPHPGFSLQ